MSNLWRYASLALPLAFAGYPLYIFAPDYYVTQFGVSLTLLGALLMGLRLFDAVLDPLIGHWSDKGHFKIVPLFICSAITLCLSLFALFNPIIENKSLWFGIFMLLATISTSVITINYNTLGGLWQSEPQTRITAIREGMSLLGIILAVSLPTLLGLFIAQKKDALNLFNVILTVIMIVSLFIFLNWYKNIFKPIYVEKTIFNLTTFSVKTRKLYVIYSLSLLASSFPAVLVVFFIRDLLKAEHLTGLFLLLYFAAGACSMPFWHKLSLVRGKVKAWGFGMILGAFSFVWAYFLGAGNVIEYALICIISGFALGADLSLPPAILADIIHHEKKQSSATTHFAMLAFIAKLALALASFIALSLLDSQGFTASKANNSASLAVLSLVYAALPSLLKLFTAGLLFKSLKVHHS